MTGAFQFCLLSATPLVTASDLFALAPALELNARHCAEAWGLAAPTVDVVDVLPERCQPVLFVDSDKDPRDFNAVHYWDALRRAPAARVYCDRTSGINFGRYSICEAAAHEIVEMLVNPDLTLWSDHPDPQREGVEVARESADPTQAHYPIEHGGQKWRVANFVHPQWFSRRLYEDEAARAKYRAAGGKFDHVGELSLPGEVGQDGYVVLRQRTDDKWRHWSESRVIEAGGALAAARKEALRHPWSRTGRLLGAA